MWSAQRACFRDSLFFKCYNGLMSSCLHFFIKSWGFLSRRGKRNKFPRHCRDIVINSDDDRARNGRAVVKFHLRLILWVALSKCRQTASRKTELLLLFSESLKSHWCLRLPPPSACGRRFTYNRFEIAYFMRPLFASFHCSIARPQTECYYLSFHYYLVINREDKSID